MLRRPAVLRAFVILLLAVASAMPGMWGVFSRAVARAQEGQEPAKNAPAEKAAEKSPEKAAEKAASKSTEKAAEKVEAPATPVNPKESPAKAETPAKGTGEPPVATPLKKSEPFNIPEGTTGPDETRPAVQPSARQVDVGIYINQIHSVSLKENNFTVDFWVWFRWEGDAEEDDPTKTFEVIDGRVDDEGGEFTRKKLKDGKNYAAKRYTYTVTEFWDIARFPRDDHTLEISIEDGEHEDHVLQFVPDKENCGVSQRVKVPGWGQGESRVLVSTHTYKSNYGDTDLGAGQQSHYSRFTMQVELKREGWGYFWKLFAGLFTATLIAMLVFFIKPTQVDPRFGLGAGAIFAAVASEYIVTSSLPDTSILTMADTLHIVSFFFIFASIAESVYSLSLDLTEEPEKCARSKFIDYLSAGVMGIGYIVVSALVVWTAR